MIALASAIGLGALAVSPLGRPVLASTLGAFGVSVLATAQEAPEGRYEPRDPVLSIRLRPYGAESPEITIPSKPCLLDIDNGTGLRETLTITLLADDRSTALLTRTLDSGRDDLVRLPAIPPGEYYITEASHPEFVVRVVVTP